MTTAAARPKSPARPTLALGLAALLLVVGLVEAEVAVAVRLVDALARVEVAGAVAVETGEEVEAAGVVAAWLVLETEGAEDTEGAAPVVPAAVVPAAVVEAPAPRQLESALD